MRPFEELSHHETDAGLVTLRRRREPMLDRDVYEVKLGDEFLMSSLFTAGEVALADLGLAAVTGDALSVCVGGLGLGYTAQAALADDRVRTCVVVEAVPTVISWHEQGLLPDVAGLAHDPRVELRQADFFALDLGGPYDAVLLDVDHSPRHLLHPRHAGFYTVAGLRRLAAHLRPGGVFALWSDDGPDDAFVTTLDDVFDATEAHVVRFPNPLTGGTNANTVYVAS